jgi:hypothetical protein
MIEHEAHFPALAVIADQSHLFTCIHCHQRDQERDEVRAALAVGDRVDDSTGFVIHAAVNDLLLVLARRGYLRLRADWHPHPRQRRVTIFMFAALRRA